MNGSIAGIEADDSTDSGIDQEQLGNLRHDMLRFATLQLRDSHLAEDVVHEAIAAALKATGFEQRASFKTWVFSILRNKIVDVIRERQRHPVETLLDEDLGDLDDAFDERGHWRKDQRPIDWGHPETVLANEQFWIVFEACLNHLPENTARVFMMREHLGLDIREICEELVISESNCWVIMHRARMRLRLCLEQNYL
ncbi:MAG: sigma-70 family RNA polymerase sigma factor [Gammaproteobacteria bacterium]|nr:MAG: sigma-70 family RNA polymerase sigma factor [Gammaproteobacteria bacterium]